MIKKTLMALAIAAATVSAFAAGYPEKTTTIVVPFPPGGSTDAIARVVAQKLQEKFGQSFIIDNRAGATGTIGAAFVKRAPADGYTLFVSSLGPFVIAPHLIKGVQYDALKDFDPITIAVQAPNVLVVPANSPDKSLAELLAHLKKNPGKVSFASSGNGSSDHLSAELFWQQTNTEGLHVPYKGGGPAMQDVIAGHVKIMFSSLVQTTPFIQSGQLRALGVGGTKRNPILPDVPTIAEAGVPGYEANNWWGIMAPAGTPKEIVDRLYRDIQATLKSPELTQAFDREGAAAVTMSSEEFAAYIQNEIVKWGRVVKEGNIKAQ
jgi:tripartite-type tricarboxylate transporter receptor subunit TctC